MAVSWEGIASVDPRTPQTPCFLLYIDEIVTHWGVIVFDNSAPKMKNKNKLK